MSATQPSQTDKITKAELAMLFGDEVPIEVVDFIFASGDGNLTVGEMRAWVRDFAETKGPRAKNPKIFPLHWK